MRASVPLALAFLLPLAACGDDPEPEHACQVPASPALPTEGELTDPADLPLPASCVPGGLADLPGRWFVSDLTQTFSFGYPRFDGSCAEGFRSSLSRTLDDDPSDGRSFHTWSDGTVYFERFYFSFPLEDGGRYDIVRASAVCMLPDGTLATASASHDPDNQFRFGTGTGERFALKDEPARGFERLGSLAASSPDRRIIGYQVVVDGDHAYVVGPEGLDIIDVTDPTQPVARGHLGGTTDMLDGMNDVRVVRGANGRVIAFGSALSGDATYVIDVTDPAAPVYLADIPEFSHSVQVRVDGERTLLYLATYTASVPVYDITDPTQPIRLGAPTVADGDDAGIHDLTVDGDRIYVNNTTDGVIAIDVSAGLDVEPVELYRIPTTYSHASWVATIGERRVLLHGDEGMTPEGGAFLRIIDDTPGSPTFGQLIGRYQSRRQVGIHNIQVVGTKVYLSYYQDGIRVLDIADPTQPREIAHYNTWNAETARGSAFEGAVGVRFHEGLVYVADTDEGLIILRETP